MFERNNQQQQKCVEEEKKLILHKHGSNMLIIRMRMILNIMVVRVPLNNLNGNKETHNHSKIHFNLMIVMMNNQRSFTFD